MKAWSSKHALLIGRKETHLHKCSHIQRHLLSQRLPFILQTRIQTVLLWGAHQPRLCFLHFFPISLCQVSCQSFCSFSITFINFKKSQFFCRISSWNLQGLCTALPNISQAESLKYMTETQEMAQRVGAHDLHAGTPGSIPGTECFSWALLMVVQFFIVF